jgi:hypothetical protein
MMKKKTKPKRFLTAQSITREIDLYKLKLQRLLDRASSFDMQADDLFKSGLTEDATYHREQAKKMRRAAFRIEKKRLPFLARKLAAFNTELLPGVITDGDRSVSARGES